MASLFVGTSGWSYTPWRGVFYPEKLPPGEMLAFYSSHFNSVEINNSFYRMPAVDVMAKWRDSVPENFRFAFKAPQAITHRRRLKDAGEVAGWFIERLQAVGERRGPVLFQLPPTMRADTGLLSEFLDAVKPLAGLLAFEFRHESWLEEPVFNLLSTAGASLCTTETDEATQPIKPSSKMVYLRLRKSEYTDDELTAWRSRIDDLLKRDLDVYCFFKHEDKGKGPAYVKELLGG
jgi:uncharacterized protein YecE (DUF72 family)